jgi:KaiC/GvpD/RAD55 family RecA-like ATPase
MFSSEVFPGANLLIEGEVPRGVYLLVGNSGAGKTTFCKTFIARGLANNETAIYLSTDEDCRKIQASIHNLMDEKDRGKGDLRLVDAYSWRFQRITGNEPFVAVNPADLTGVMITCQKVCHDVSNPRFVFDSITDLEVQSNSETTLKFLQLVTANIRRMNAMAFFTLIPTSHDSKFVSTVKTMFDGVIEMRLDEIHEEITRLYRIFSMKGANHKTRWIIFTVTERGISIDNDNTPRCAWCGGVIPYAPYVATIRGLKCKFHAPECADNYRKAKAWPFEAYSCDLK